MIQSFFGPKHDIKIDLHTIPEQTNYWTISKGYTKKYKKVLGEKTLASMWVLAQGFAHPWLSSRPPTVQVSKGRRVTINNIIHSVAIVNDIKKWKTALKTKLEDDIKEMEKNIKDL